MKQIVTETDYMQAVFDYMAEQLEGRFRLEFPEAEEIIDHMVDSLRNGLFRLDAEYMHKALRLSISTFGTSLTECMLDGCPNESQHNFCREYINLVWDARSLTREWLKGQGIVSGQSTN